jgi:hypothetical protein
VAVALVALVENPAEPNKALRDLVATPAPATFTFR